MNVLRYVFLPIACGVALSATAAPVSNLDGVAVRMIAVATQSGDTSTAVSLDATSMASTIASIAAPVADGAKKTSAIAGPAPQAVPEPGSLALLGIAGAALFASRKRRAAKV